MDFNPLTDFYIFDDLLIKRPEINKDRLTEDLNNYYLPYIQKLLILKQQLNSQKGIIIGISAIQGAGKSTQGEILEILLKHLHFNSVSLSIDDHYLTHPELCQLRNQDPRFIRRGATHDIPLAIQNLTQLQAMTDDHPVLVSGYDKSAHSGDGDRFAWVNITDNIAIGAKVVQSQQIINKQLQTSLVLKIISITYKNYHLDIPSNMGSDIPLITPYLPQELIDFLTDHQNQPIIISQEDKDNINFLATKTINIPKKSLPNGWRIVSLKPDFIFYDGWMLGARTVLDDSVFSLQLPALETQEAIQFAKDVNKKLTTYEPLWNLLQFLNCLFVPNYQNSLKWRDQAEEHQRQKGSGMTHEQIKEFVYYFWRSVHPAIHIKNIAYDTIHTNQVVIINDDHTIGEVLTPAETITKYP